MGHHRLHDRQRGAHPHGRLAGQSPGESQPVPAEPPGVYCQFGAVRARLGGQRPGLFPHHAGGRRRATDPDGHGVDERCLSATGARVCHGTLWPGLGVWPGGGACHRRLPHRLSELAGGVLPQYHPRGVVHGVGVSGAAERARRAAALTGPAGARRACRLSRVLPDRSEPEPPARLGFALHPAALRRGRRHVCRLRGDRALAR